MKTAIEFFEEKAKALKSDFDDLPTWAIEAARELSSLHVRAALEKAAEEAVAKEDPQDYGTGKIWVDKNSILRAYPEYLIK